MKCFASTSKQKITAFRRDAHNYELRGGVAGGLTSAQNFIIFLHINVKTKYVEYNYISSNTFCFACEQWMNLLITQ